MSTPLNDHILPVKERKVSQSASCKIDSIIRQLFLPMLGMPTPERTSFLAEDAEDQLLRQVAQERPDALGTESVFVDYMVLLYRKFQRELSAPVNPVDPANPVNPVNPVNLGLRASHTCDSNTAVTALHGNTAINAASEALDLIKPGAGEPSM